jgi:hypothetical protein
MTWFLESGAAVEPTAVKRLTLGGSPGRECSLCRREIKTLAAVRWRDRRQNEFDQVIARLCSIRPNH